MLIRRIKSIKDFGIYKDFKWGGDTPEFQNRNIIYGWNYSGKTTLSRFISRLSGHFTTEDESKIEYEVEICETPDKTRICKSPIENLNVFVFNNEYVERNLHFSNLDNPKITGISFDIGEVSVEKREKLNDLSIQIRETKQWFKNNHNHIDNFDALDKVFTVEAKAIKNNIFESQIEFTRSHLKKIISQLVTSELEKYIISDAEQLTKVRSNALARQSMTLIDETFLSLDLCELVADVNKLLSFCPEKIDDNYILSEYTELYQWGEFGLDYYKRNPQIKICAFCGNPISSARLNELNRFYSNEAAKLRSQILSLINRIDALIESLKTHVSRIINSNDIIESERPTFETNKSQCLELIIKLSSFLNTLISKLREKENEHLFEGMECVESPEELSREYSESTKALLATIHSHNEVVLNFEKVKNDSIDRLKKHCVAQILKSREYTKLLKLKDRQEREILSKHKTLESLQNEFDHIQSEIKSLSKGREALNDFIHKFLGRKDLEIQTTEDDFFVLRRGEQYAMQLSEGEKTAIAFSYFMVSLESLKTDGVLKESIVFIDDPISSLDANHIAQVSSLINSFFFYKDATGRICEHFAQLFIATHNFEFFSFIRDANNIKRQPKKDKSGSRCEIFLLKRIAESKVCIQRLPKTFSNYNSEYLYLFSEIYAYYNEGCKEEKAYMLPNIIRRFLEIYTRIKLPGNHDEVDNRIKIIMGENVNELKILHYFSHFTTLERVTKHSDIIMRLPEITEDLFKLLRRDKAHLDSLIEGIK